MRLWAARVGLMDHPNWRSSHVAPTPRGGGIFIVVAVLVAFTASWLLDSRWPLRELILLLIGMLLVAAVSWMDDRRSCPRTGRLAVHLSAALLAIAATGSWKSWLFGSWGTVPLGLSGTLITLLWIVGMTNAYNFMDGIDGIAGSQAFVAGVGWTILGMITSSPVLIFTGLALGGSSLGFLCHNWSPARIFMGDVGSAFVGYFLAVLTVLSFKHAGVVQAAGIFVVWPFVWDTTFTLLRRLLRREDPFSAHRSHLYQRLTAVGFSHAHVSLIYAGLATVGLFFAVCAQRVTRNVGLDMLILAGIGGTLCSWVLFVECRFSSREFADHGNCGREAP